MRRFLIPLLFVGLLTIAATVPVAADGPETDKPKVGCDFTQSI